MLILKFSLSNFQYKREAIASLLYYSLNFPCLRFLNSSNILRLNSSSTLLSNIIFLAERMVNYGNTWLYSSSLYSNKLNTDNIDSNVNIFLSMLYPYLTHSGKKEFQNLLPKFFE